MSTGTERAFLVIGFSSGALKSIAGEKPMIATIATYVVRRVRMIVLVCRVVDVKNYFPARTL